MRLEDMTVAVRVRTPFELYDLALQLCRRYWWQLLLLGGVGGIPWALMIAVTATMAESEIQLLCAAWLLFALAPLMVAPVTVFIGQAMFSTAPSWRHAMAQAWLSSVRLVPSVVRRGVCALIPIFLPWARAYHNEVVLLERQGWGAAGKRAGALNRAGMESQMLHLLFGALVMALTVWIAFGTFSAVVGLWSSGSIFGLEDVWFEDAWQPFLLLPIVLATVIGMVFMAVVRFCAYIDLRTRREGWDLELELRRAAARIDQGLM